MEYAIFLLLLLYLLPWMVAELRGHPRATQVLLLNAVLGWTGIGWLAALAWAGRREPAEPGRTRPLLRGLAGGREHEPLRADGANASRHLSLVGPDEVRRARAVGGRARRPSA